MSAAALGRRRCRRHPLSGTVKWVSSAGSGAGELLEIARDGAAFVVARDDVPRVRGGVTLRMDLSPEVEWHIAAGAIVEQITPRDARTSCVSVTFPES